VKVLVACERSGAVRDAFAARGHEAWSCDVRAAPGNHFQCDVLEIADGRWDLMIAHPPCTHLATSGARWMADKKKQGLLDFRDGQLRDVQARSFAFVRALLATRIPRIAIENPVGVLSSLLRKPDQIVHPWQFGDSFSKRTCLWLYDLPPLVPTEIVERGEIAIHGGKRIPRWYSNRERDRSATFPGMARAMAEQWGCLEVEPVLRSPRGGSLDAAAELEVSTRPTD